MVVPMPLGSSIDWKWAWCQRTGEQEAVHLVCAIDIGADDLIRFVDAKGCGVGRVWEIELGEGRTFEQEASDGTI